MYWDPLYTRRPWSLRIGTVGFVAVTFSSTSTKTNPVGPGTYTLWARVMVVYDVFSRASPTPRCIWFDLRLIRPAHTSDVKKVRVYSRIHDCVIMSDVIGTAVQLSSIRAMGHLSAIEGTGPFI